MKDDTFCDTCNSFRHDTADCPIPLPRREGYAYTSEVGGYRYAVFSRAAVEAFEPDLSEPSLASRLTGWGERYGGPGRGFAHAPALRVFKRNVLVTQYTGLDI